MIKKIILLLIIMLLIVGCGRKKEYKIDNSKDDYVTTDKGNINFTYDEKKFNVTILGDNRLLKNEKDNYKLYLASSTNNVVRQELEKVSYASDTEYNLKEIKINKYEGYVQFGKKVTVANIYLYIDKESDVILYVSISEIKNSKKVSGEDLYKNKDIQALLHSIKFDKKK